MTSTEPKNGRLRRTPRALHRALAGLLCLIPAVGLLLAASVQPWQQAVLHLLVLLAAIVVVRYPDHHHADAGRTLRLGLASLPILAVVLVGLVPLPPSILAIVAPGAAEARPDRWYTLSVDPESTVSELATISLFVSFALLVAFWAERGRKQIIAEWVVAITAAVLVGTAYLHAALDLKRVFGLLPVVYPPERFFAPFVNPNHLGSALLLAVPLLVFRGLEARGEGRVIQWAYWVVLAGIAVLPFAASSMGVLVALVVQLTLIAVWMSRSRLRWLALGLLPIAIGIGGVVIRTFNEGWWRKSGEPRMLQYLDTPTVFADHWLFGAGAGAYGTAYMPHRSIKTYEYFMHAHSDPQEWLVETGLAGVVAVGLALWLLPRSPTGTRRAVWTLGLLGLLVHACIEFPLQVPAVGLLAVGMLAIRLAAFDAPKPSSPTLARAVFVVLALVQIPAGLWQLRTQFADRSARTILTFDVDPAAAVRADQRLALLAPWRPERALLVAWKAEARGNKVAAAEEARRIVDGWPHDPEVLRRAAVILYRSGDRDGARAALDRSILRDPNDFRTFQTLSAVLELDGDTLAAAEAWADALRHWPRQQMEGGAPLDRAWKLLPLGVWWLDALEDAPGHWSAHLAFKLIDEGEPELALLACDQAERLKPDVFKDVAARSDALLMLGRVQEAEQYARQLTYRHPESPWGWVALARVLEAKDQPDDALDAWLSAFEARPERRIGLMTLDAAYRLHGSKRALATAQRLETRLPDDPHVGLRIAQLHLDAGDRHACREELVRRHLLDHVDIGDRAKRLHQRCNGGA